MRTTIRLGIALAAAAALAVGLSGTAGAQPGSSGSGLQVSILGNVVTVPPTPLVNFPPGGSASTVSVPGGLASVLSVSASGSSTSANSTATAANANVPSFVSAVAVGSTCSASPAGTVGNSTLVGATVAGTPVGVNPAPNTSIGVPGLGAVTLNGQSSSASGLRVRALEVTTNPPLPTDIVLSESDCGLSLVGAASASAASVTSAMPTLTG